MLFKDVIGQKEIKTKLLQIVKDKRVGHALLFTGKEGTGKLGLAIALGRYLNCMNQQDDDSCGECSSCRKYNRLEHPDLHFVFPVATTKNVEKEPVSDDFLTIWRESVLANPYMGLSQWYEFLGIENKQGSINKNESRQIIKKLSFKSFEAANKIMIIWMAEKMNITAANKLLKILEEPPPDTVFMLIAEDTSQILPTILSRAQLVKIPKIDQASMKKALVEIHDIQDYKRIESLVKVADGNYLQLTQAVQKTEETNFYFEMFVKLMRLCFIPDIAGISSWIDDMAIQGRERQKQFCQNALRIIRGNFILNIQAGDIDLMSEEEKNFSAKFSKFIHSGNVISLYQEINKASVHIEYNGYSRLTFFDLALKIAKLLKI